jgi:hypothetical protein
MGVLFSDQLSDKRGLQLKIGTAPLRLLDVRQTYYWFIGQNNNFRALVRTVTNIASESFPRL